MAVRSGTRRGGLIVALLLAGLLCLAAPAGDAPAGTPPPAQGPAPVVARGALQAAFEAAPREFGVPERVLLALAYNFSRWDTHAGAPSVAGGYGTMHLIHVDRMPSFNARGDDAPPRAAAPNAAALHTLDEAAALLGLDADLLK